MFFDPIYFIFIAPGILLAIIASMMTKSTFKKYSKVTARSGISGAEAAQRLLHDAGIDDVRIESVSGFLSDHYNPLTKTLRLSHDVYANPSLSAIGVACHEAGHAIQHARGFAPLYLRTTFVPLQSIASGLYIWVIMAGMILRIPQLMIAGVIIFSLTVIFSIITLPVEWDASRRAKKLMVSAGIVTEREAADSAKVLNAAFMTYVASALTAVLTLLYYLVRSGLLGGRR